MNSLKVLLIVTGLPDVNGHGSSEFNLRFVEALEKRNVNVAVVHLRSISPRRSLVSRRLINNKIECYTISAFISVPGLRPIFLHQLFKRLLINLPLTYDVIHAVGGGAVVAAGIAAELSKRSLVLQFIGGDVNTALPNHLKKRRFKATVNNAGYICFNSAALLKKFDSKHSLRDSRTRVIRRGADLRYFDFKFELKDEIRVLFLGGAPNGNSKGAYTLIDAIKILRSQSLPTPLRFIIGGPNSEKLATKMPRRTEYVQCEVVGPIPKSEVKRMLELSHVVVIPSLNEGIPNVLFEAMASGNLVIASDVGGISEVLQHGQTGFLVDPNRPDQLAERIAWASANAGITEKFAVNGRDVVGKYEYENSIKKYIDIYRDIACIC